MKSILRFILSILLVLIGICFFVAPWIYVFVNPNAAAMTTSDIVIETLLSIVVMAIGLLPMFAVKFLVDDYVGFVSFVVHIVIIIACSVGAIYFSYRGIVNHNYWLFWLSLPLFYFVVDTLSRIAGIISCGIGLFGALILFVCKMSMWELCLPLFIVSLGYAGIVEQSEDGIVDTFSTPKEEREASVIKRAIVGGLIAGGAGAVVGALSAVDKNNRLKK